MSTERYFEIRKEVGLGFFNGTEQYDQLIDPGQGYLMFDGRDIYWIVDGQERMSDTINEAISIWLDQKRIEEVRQRPAGCRLLPERYFAICKVVSLCFRGNSRQYSQLIEPGHGYLTFNGSSICWVVDGRRHMTDNDGEAISIWLDERLIEEVYQRPSA